MRSAKNSKRGKNGRCSRFFTRRLSLSPERVSVLRRGGGAGGTRHRAGPVSCPNAARGGFCRNRALDHTGRPATDRVLRVRAVLARAVHGGRVSLVQRAVCGGPRGM